MEQCDNVTESNYTFFQGGVYQGAKRIGTIEHIEDMPQKTVVRWTHDSGNRYLSGKKMIATIHKPLENHHRLT